VSAINLEWLLTPVGGYIAVGLSNLAILSLFLSVKREIAQTRAGASRSIQELAEHVNTLSLAVGQSRQQPEREEPSDPRCPQYSASLNVSRRARVLAMHKRGFGVETIADTMRVPENEVRLLLHIQQLLH
jgi:hypothetical protein